MAPEVALERDYDGMCCDVWSMGIVLLEVMCARRIVEHVLNLKSAGDAPPPELVVRIKESFARPGVAGEMHKRFGTPESQPFFKTYLPAYNGSLTVDVMRRWTSTRVLEVLRSFGPS